MAIQILQYEFLGPIKISEWGPPMEAVVYIIFSKSKDAFNMLYVGETEKTVRLRRSAPSVGMCLLQMRSRLLRCWN